MLKWSRFYSRSSIHSRTVQKRLISCTVRLRNPVSPFQVRNESTSAATVHNPTDEDISFLKASTVSIDPKFEPFDRSYHAADTSRSRDIMNLWSLLEASLFAFTLSGPGFLHTEFPISNKVTQAILCR